MKPLRAGSDSISVEAVEATIQGWKYQPPARRPVLVTEDGKPAAVLFPPGVVEELGGALERAEQGDRKAAHDAVGILKSVFEGQGDAAPAREPLGARLRAACAAIDASGVPHLVDDEVERELADRRGGVRASE